jgi:signal transduction histidine kinase
VTEHGGRIYAKSQPGKGTTLIVKFPLAAKKNKV